MYLFFRKNLSVESVQIENSVIKEQKSKENLSKQLKISDVYKVNATELINFNQNTFAMAG